MFMKFQSQIVHTNDPGDPSGGSPVPDPAKPVEDGAVMIVAAMVNPKGDDVREEYLYLLNMTDHDIDLSGWMIADKLKKKDTIQNNVLGSGDITRVTLSGNGAQLSNDGGIITLLNKEGLKIHGVSYTKAQVSKQGVITVF